MATLYTIYYDNVPNVDGDGAIGYSGSSRRDLATDDAYLARDGSMTPRGKKRMQAAHDRLNVEVRRRMEVRWHADDEDLVRDELEMIKRLRHNDPRYGFNLMPQIVGVNIAVKLVWDHDPVTHIDSSRRKSFAFAVFHKRQSLRTDDGMCSYRTVAGRHHCGAVWGDADPNLWAKISYPDGREEQLWVAGDRGDRFKACMNRKDQMLDELGLNIP